MKWKVHFLRTISKLLHEILNDFYSAMQLLNYS